MNVTDGLTVYLVGGAVRDTVLGRTVTERDYVVVGATPAEMQQRGFQQVGKDFPVFLHPHTKAEYALARTERKTAPGYHGFAIHAAPEVTLEQDLLRRDLTINALAQDANGTIIDPYGGLADVAARQLRHISPAFAEDPVRILRVARFATRFAALGFQVAAETRDLMRAMVNAGEVEALVPERVWQEITKALLEAQPAHFFTTLRDCGALARLLPELDRLWGIPQSAQWHPEGDAGIHTLLVLEMAARLAPELEVRFAALCHDFGKGTTPPELWPRHHGHEARSAELVKLVSNRLKIPNHCRDLARLTAQYHGIIHRVAELRPATMLEVFEATDALRRPARFAQLLTACEADFRGRGGYAERHYTQAEVWRQMLAAVAVVDVGAIARAAPAPAEIPTRIRAARLAALTQAVALSRIPTAS
ncbi:multifunctional CCA addition/repair protein [Chromatium okenii]|uniref:multifunctional CCA addition/repair protein n=1 Tax=Chromatium okenii TaxID=61644 RepID=UPI00237BF0F9|nr:multifunctional CCA addition/repair protein [Chromatium okenii]